MGAVDVSARFGEGGGELIGGRYAPAYGEPPEELAARARALLVGETEGEDAGGENQHAATRSGDKATVVVGARTWHVSVISTSVGNRERVVGALAIESNGPRYVAPDALLVDQIARELYEAGDVTAIRSRPAEGTSGSVG